MIINYGKFDSHNKLVRALDYKGCKKIKELELREAVSKIQIESMNLIDVVFVRAPQYEGESRDKLVEEALAKAGYTNTAEKPKNALRFALTRGNLLVDLDSKGFYAKWFERTETESKAA